MAGPEAIATIRLTNDEDGTHEVPADVLARTLSGLQQLVYLIATTQENRRIRDRFRLPQEIQQRYSLSCRVPQSGSYAMPIALGSGDVDSSLFTNYSDLLSRTEMLFSSIQTGQLDPLFDVFPDEKVRNRALREVRKLLPKPGEGWRFGFQRDDHPEILLIPDNAVPLIDRELAQDTPENTVMTVTGELIRIDFDRRTVVLRHPVTHKEIECVYVDELEETMIENRRGMIQATGRFTLDDEGYPNKLTDVTQLEPVDLSPISLKIAHWNDREFRFRQPLTFNPSLDEESQQFYVVEDPVLTLLAYAQTREQLLQEISEQIAFMWDAYVGSSEDELTPDALRLRQKLIETVSENRNATSKV
ncbi:MAG: hypothetical protein IGS54_02140 [Elainella sp. C42_A2020_010]|nr:hypothetical protein [Elainella sp. C42_A2020_010]